MNTGKVKVNEDAPLGPLAEPLPGGNNLDKVRDILFGAQVRENERRFSRMEERMLKENEDLRTEVRKRLDTLEAYIRAELETLTDRLKAEENSRTEAVSEATQSLKDTAKNFDKRVAQLDEQMLKGQRDLRQQLLDQSTRFADDMQRNQSNNTAQLERAETRLQSEKTGRQELASMLMEVAMRLNNEFNLPDGE